MREMTGEKMPCVVVAGDAERVSCFALALAQRFPSSVTGSMGQDV